MNFRERYHWTWQYLWPMTAVELIWSGFSYLSYGESWYVPAEAIHAVVSTFVISPWACRRAIGYGYPTFRILTFGYGRQEPKQISYLESFKVAWLLGWRSEVLILPLFFLLLSLLLAPLKRLLGMAEITAGASAAASDFYLTLFAFAMDMLLLPLIIPGMLKKKYRGFHIERAEIEPPKAAVPARKKGK